MWWLKETLRIDDVSWCCNRCLATAIPTALPALGTTIPEMIKKIAREWQQEKLRYYSWLDFPLDAIAENYITIKCSKVFQEIDDYNRFNLLRILKNFDKLVYSSPRISTFSRYMVLRAFTDRGSRKLNKSILFRREKTQRSSNSKSYCPWLNITFILMKLSKFADVSLTYSDPSACALPPFFNNYYGILLECSPYRANAEIATRFIDTPVNAFI